MFLRTFKILVLKVSKCFAQRQLLSHQLRTQAALMYTGQIQPLWQPRREKACRSRSISTELDIRSEVFLILILLFGRVRGHSLASESSRGSEWPTQEGFIRIIYVM